MSYLNTTINTIIVFGGVNMYISLSFLCGVIVTTMNIFNNQLSNYCGVYLSTVIIHLVGLVSFIIIMKLKNQKISLKNHLPLILYTGGMIGVLTVMFNIVAINSLGVTLLTALGLLGQLLTSVILEHNGWLGSIQQKITFPKLISLAIIVIGIGVMI